KNATYVGQRCAGPRTAAERRRAISIGRWFVIGEVDPPVLRKTRVQYDIHEPFEATLAARLHGRNPLYRARVEHAMADNPQATGTLGDEHRTIGQKCD